MNTNPLHEGAIIIHGIGIGEVTPEMVRQRAAELATINGREPHEVSKSDWDEAQRELNGGGELDPQQELLDSAPESDRWNPIPGSEGHGAPVAIDDNEDEDGRSVGERLFQEGVDEAGHDQMLQAAEKNLLADD
jgi:hypothetical protein